MTEDTPHPVRDQLEAYGRLLLEQISRDTVEKGEEVLPLIAVIGADGQVGLIALAGESTAEMRHEAKRAIVKRTGAIALMFHADTRIRTPEGEPLGEALVAMIETRDEGNLFLMREYERGEGGAIHWKDVVASQQADSGALPLWGSERIH